MALIAKEAFGNKSGARDLRRVIRRQVEDPICTLLVEQVNGQVALVKAMIKTERLRLYRHKETERKRAGKDPALSC